MKASATAIFLTCAAFGAVALHGQQTNKPFSPRGTAATQIGGTWVGHDPWGRRKLAYEIDKKTDGVYHLLQFDAEPATTPGVIASSAPKCSTCTSAGETPSAPSPVCRDVMNPGGPQR